MKTRGTALPKVHGIDIGVGPNLMPEKQVVNLLSIPDQLHVPTDSKDQFNENQSICQNKADIKRKIIQRFPMPQ